MSERYDYERVYKETLEWFKGDDLATSVWINSYCLKDREGKLLESSPKQMWERLAKELTGVELKYNTDLQKEFSDCKLIEDTTFYRNLLDMFINRNIIPGGSSLYGIGNTHSYSSLGNCFVISNKIDSYASICKTDEEQIQLMKRRGGVGHDLSHLRFSKAPVNGCANTSTGAVSFASRYSHSTREVAQGGRRGALMLTMDIRHPDSDEFRDLKTNKTAITGANISIKFTDKFMESVELNKPFLQSFPVDIEPLEDEDIVLEESEEGVLNSAFDKYNGDFTFKKVDAKRFWDKFIDNNYNFAEPGALFWDRVIQDSLAGCYGEEWREVSTNPCGELPLCPYDSCRLLSVNYYSCVRAPFTDHASFDFEKFRGIVKLSQRILDNIIDLEVERIDSILSLVNSSYEERDIIKTEVELWNKIREKLLSGRRTGLGPIGVADMLAALNIQYGTVKASNFIEEVQRVAAIASYESSIDMAEERGAFPIWNLGVESENQFMKRIYENLSSEYQYKYELHGRRNIVNLTAAPTGTTSLITQCSSSLEPVFKLFYLRRKKLNANEENQEFDFVDEVGDKWKEFVVVHPGLRSWLTVNIAMLINEGELSEETTELKLADWERIARLSPYHEATANEIDYLEKVRMQGRVQRWIDHSISITHNLPETITKEEVSQIYMLAWKSGCKGCTIYREGSRSGVLVDVNKKKKVNFSLTNAIKRPEEVKTIIHTLTALKRKWIVLVGLIDEKPFEIFNVPEDNLSHEELLGIKQNTKFTTVKKKKRHYQLIGDVTGVVIDSIVSKMDNEDDASDTKRLSLELRHGIPTKFIVETIEKQPKDITSFDKAICRVLKKYIKDDESSSLRCEKCGGEMIYQSGCPICKDCGHTKCG